MTAFLILAACLLVAGFGVLLGSLAPTAFGFGLFLVAGVFIVGVVIDAWRRYGIREAAEWAAGLAIVVGLFVAATSR
jgi:hypothetical protein